MLKLLTLRTIFIPKTITHFKNCSRTFLSPAYHCDDVWNNRLNTPLLQSVKLNELYQEIDSRYQKTKEISPVDVDIFVNNVDNVIYLNDMLDLVYKLRLSGFTHKTLPSTGHAVLRFLLKYPHREELLNVLNDRLNYGIFLDTYLANIFMNKFLTEKDYVAGVNIASQLMLQEETDNKLNKAFALYHCIKFLQEKCEWSAPEVSAEPEEEVKIRVKYLRNPYQNHFDIVDPQNIIGRILVDFTRLDLKDIIDKSIHILGLCLINRAESIEPILESSNVILKDILYLMPPESNHARYLEKATFDETISLIDVLESNIKKSVDRCMEQDIAAQCDDYEKWLNIRNSELETQRQRLQRISNLDKIDKTQKKLVEKEQLLWFFENEEKIELDIEKKLELTEQKSTEFEQEIKVVEDLNAYVPPEIVKNRR